MGEKTKDEKVFLANGAWERYDRVDPPYGGFLFFDAKRPEEFCSPLTGVTTNSGDPPTGHRIYDACRGSSVSWVCRGSGASIVSSTSC